MAAVLPGAVVHFKPCLPGPIATIIASSLEREIAGRKVKIPERSDLTLIRTPHVRAACVDGAQRIGLWITRPSGTQGSSYDQGLAELDILKSGETFAVHVSKPRLVDPLGDRFWDALPKLWTRSGNPADDGKVHLRGFDVDFAAPNRVVTKLNGTYRATGPNPDFKVTITDTLSTSQGRIKCATDRDTDMSFSLAEWLIGSLLTGGLGTIGLAIADAIGEGAAASVVEDESGIGGYIAANAPAELALPPGVPGGLSKANFRYSRLDISSGGITAGGTIRLS